MWDNLLFAASIDIIVLFTSSYLLFRYAHLSIYHPAPTYLVFHLYIITFRLIFLCNGGGFFLENQSYFTEIESHEIVRAALIADVSFISMTIAWLWEASLKVAIKPAESIILLDEKILTVSLFVVIPVGLWGILSQLYIPGIGKADLDFGAWAKSSYFVNAQNWIVLGLIMVVFKFGFKKLPLLIIVACLFILLFQGELRYRIVIPSIFLMFLYLHRKSKKWLSWHQTIFILFGGLVFLPLKYVGKLIQQGANLSDLIEFASEYQEGIGMGDNADFSFLDVYASILTLIDQSEKFFYGSTYTTLLLAPIPRPWWEDKPSLMQWMTDISTPTRNLKSLGAVATLYGESYANFGYWGIIIIPFLFAKYSARWYFNVKNTHAQSANLFAYLYFSAILIQVYRDGLNAIFMFLSVYNMPGFFVYVFSILKGKRVA
jgi:oligosaccharide repeat unit polymerase